MDIKLRLHYGLWGLGYALALVVVTLLYIEALAQMPDDLPEWALGVTTILGVGLWGLLIGIVWAGLARWYFYPRLKQLKKEAFVRSRK